MNYKYQLKNEELENALKVIFDKKYVENELQRQMTNDSRTFYIEIDDEEGIKAVVKIPKEEVERVRVYDPNNWNPYPEVKPPKRGYYLVTRIRNRDNGDTYKGVDLCLFGLNNSDIFTNSNILAFRELPEPYDPMPWENDDSDPQWRVTNE
ncbi:hypothetical protein [Parasutterella excrementihominis]|uniref:hypothetical protein n=1 Tax=Parasutterella excrementihominis TaxID=487175 RepID=UPI0012BBEA28|nr:hypothetical protein [Parasutterella excrementihominis]MTT64680.1 hypothetical protein [Parasutterella excrementihominis]MTT93001.1 hypothetical protein [Parasutterella excrementihominis]